MKIDVHFGVFPRGTPLPVDNSYMVYSAISRVIPAIHEDEDIGIFPIAGIQTGDRKMILTPESRLTIRLDAERIPMILPLAGKSLGLGQTFMQIGVPTVHALSPSETLRSRLVTIKGFMEEDGFIAAVQRQLELNHLSPDVIVKPGKRRTLCIHDKNVVGFELYLGNLNENDSIRIQETGIGGRRKMGCGLFLPSICDFSECSIVSDREGV